VPEDGDRVLHPHKQQESKAHELSIQDVVILFWMNSFGISKAAFKVFRMIVKASWFEPSEVRCFKTYKKKTDYLPLLPTFVRQHDLGEGKSVVSAHHSLFDVIQRAFEFPGNFDTMVFQAEVGHSLREFWHGRVWAESPLFTHSSIVNPTTNMEFQHGDNVCFGSLDQEQLGRVVALYSDEETKEVCCMLMPYERCGDGQLYLRWNAQVALQGKDLLCKVDVSCNDDGGSKMVCHGVVVDQPEGTVVKSLSKLPELLSELVRPDSMVMLQRNIQRNPTFDVFKLFLVYFFDDFGAYSKVYHKTGGGYITLGNFPRHMRVLLRNIFVIHLAPPGVTNSEIAKTLRVQIRSLEDSVIMDFRITSLEGDVTTNRSIVVGGIGCGVSDMPQGNDMAEIRRQSALRGCRSCYTTTEELSEARITSILHNRTREETVALRAATKGLNVAETESLLQEAGLTNTEEQSMLNGVVLNTSRQLPHDPYHSHVIGNSGSVVLLLWKALNDNAREQLNGVLSQIALPMGWAGKCPTVVITYKMTKVKLGAEQVKRLFQVLPLVLPGWLKPEHFTTKYKNLLTRRLGERFCDFVVESILAQSRVNSLVFAEAHVNCAETCEELKNALRYNNNLAHKVWHRVESKVNMGVPNRHVSEHQEDAHKDFGGLINCSCARWETKHACMRCALKNSNHFFPEVNMMEAENIASTLQFMALGGAGYLLSEEVRSFLNEDTEVKRILRMSNGLGTYTGNSNDEREPSKDEIPGKSISAAEICRQTFAHVFENFFELELNQYLASSSPTISVILHDHIVLKSRELYASRLQPGCFFLAERTDGPPHIVRIEACLSINEEKRQGAEVGCWVEVKSYTPIDTVQFNSILQSDSDSIFIPASCILRPLHVLHKCTIHCRDENGLPIPPGLYGFRGTHDATNTYVLNSSYIK
jgi:hypothetical protein